MRPQALLATKFLRFQHASQLTGADDCLVLLAPFVKLSL
jgi:hypothetical protein